MGLSSTSQQTAPVSMTGMPQLVPADYVGLIFRGWPLYSNAFWTNPNVGQQFPLSAPPAPTGVNFKSTRLYDTAYSFWYEIETSAGVYNWTNFDIQITTFRQLGVNIGLCLGGTPLFYVTGAETTVPFYDGYGGAGYPNQTAPNGLTGLSNFITALVQRYNRPGVGAWNLANPTLGKGLAWLEISNEPQWNGVTPVGGFWHASPSQLVDWAYTIKTAAKAVDATLVITSPGSNTATNLQTFLQATGAINTGVTGASCCDAVQVHHYNVSTPGTVFNAWGYDFFGGPQVGINPWKAAMAASGPYNGALTTVPMWMGEGGFDYTAGTYELNQLNAQPPAYRSTFWQRMMMLGAASGMKKWMTYTWDSPYAATPMNDPLGVPDALNKIAANVAGKTITAASYVVGGAVTLNFNDGSTYSV